MDMERNTQYINAIKRNIGQVIVGKEQVTELLLSALLAQGHVLLEDVPGTGKTMLAKSLAKSVDVAFSRIQFTPDLLPSDVTGLNYYNQKAGEFMFRPGPVFCGILLADEINRATPRTQSSLLECMEEHQVTLDGETRRLEDPFFVIATQNPIETAGTFPLPEAQLDRFLIQVSMGMPDENEEVEILQRFLKEQPLNELKAVCSAEELRRLQRDCLEVYVHPQLMRYVVQLTEATRNKKEIRMGASPRGTLALLRIARAYALVQGRSYVIPEDVKALAVPVLAHRLILSGGVMGGQSAQNLIRELLDRIPVPTEEWTN